MRHYVLRDCERFLGCGASGKDIRPQIIEYQGGEYGCGVIGKVVNVTADESVLVNGQLDMSLVNAIAFDTYTHGYYKVTERVGEAFQEGLKLKK